MEEGSLIPFQREKEWRQPVTASHTPVLYPEGTYATYDVSNVYESVKMQKVTYEPIRFTFK